MNTALAAAVGVVELTAAVNKVNLVAAQPIVIFSERGPHLHGHRARHRPHRRAGSSERWRSSDELNSSRTAPPRRAPAARSAATTPPSSTTQPGPRGRRNIAIGSIVSRARLRRDRRPRALAVRRARPARPGPLGALHASGRSGSTCSSGCSARSRPRRSSRCSAGCSASCSRSAGSATCSWVRFLCGLYIEIARTVPVLLLIYLMLFGLPQIGINLPTAVEARRPADDRQRGGRSPRSSAPAFSACRAASARPL